MEGRRQANAQAPQGLPRRRRCRGDALRLGRLRLAVRDALALDPYRLIARSNGKTVNNVEWAGRMVFAQGDGPVKMSFYQVRRGSDVKLIVQVWLDAARMKAALG